jgi:hypothetical protein
MPNQKIEDADAAVAVSACRVRIRNNTIQSVKDAISILLAGVRVCRETTYPQYLGIQGNMRRRAIGWDSEAGFESLHCHSWQSQCSNSFQYRYGKPKSVPRALWTERIPLKVVNGMLKEVRYNERTYKQRVEQRPSRLPENDRGQRRTCHTANRERSM